MGRKGLNTKLTGCLDGLSEYGCGEQLISTHVNALAHSPACISSFAARVCLVVVLCARLCVNGMYDSESELSLVVCSLALPSLC